MNYIRNYKGNISGPMSLTRRLLACSPETLTALGYYPCTIIDERYNPIIQDRTGPDITYIPESETYEVRYYRTNKSLAAAKRFMNNDINRMVQEKMAVSYEGLQLRNEQDRLSWLELRQTIKSGVDSAAIRLQNNTVSIMTGQEFIELHNEIMDRDEEIRQDAWEAKDAIMSAETIEAALSIYNEYQGEL